MEKVSISFWYFSGALILSLFPVCMNIRAPRNYVFQPSELFEPSGLSGLVYLRKVLFASLTPSYL